VGGTARYVTRKRIQRKLAWLEHEHAVDKERSRIAQDMHDDLGARLTEIMLLSDSVKSSDTHAESKTLAGELAVVSRDLVQNLDAIVWVVNPRNDSLRNLAAYIYEFMERFLRTSGIRCRLDVPDKLPECALSSEVRHNLFLVIKETLNNIVKHAHATEVRFFLRLENSALKIAIEDNGQGFSVAEDATAGNGLANMRLRMSKIGGLFGLTSEPGKGTTTKLHLPIKLDNNPIDVRR
jgi:signal transduction histidine kinase